MKKITTLIISCALMFGSCTSETKNAQSKSAYSAYLFVYFTGNSGDQEAIRFAVSKDGYNYRALNGDKPIIESSEISKTGGVRDPHILRSENGKWFYMVVTDMVSDRGWDSNRGLVLLKSDDLVNWSSRAIHFPERFEAQDSLLRVWAPQTIYDKKAGKHMVYFSLQYAGSADVIHYAYVNGDFTDFESDPKPLFQPRNGHSCIDGDIIFKDGEYHLFYKTEDDRDGKGIRKAVTTDLTSNSWTEWDDYKQCTHRPVEGSCIFSLNDAPKYILMYDMYMDGTYQFCESEDLSNFRIIDNEVSMDFHPRHGTVIPITKEEYERITDKW